MSRANIPNKLRLFAAWRMGYVMLGFTLIEMIVVIAIIAIVSSVFFLNLREGEQNLALQRSAQLLTQTIDDARNAALSNRLHNSTVSAGGYGVRFLINSNTLIVFADCNQDSRFTDIGSGASSCLEAASGNADYQENSRTVTLERGVNIISINPCDGSCVLDVVFSSPNAKASFMPSFVDGAASVTLQAGNDQLSVTINNLGVPHVQ